jgi:formylmethanofuran dehydrogenase subunit E
MFEIDRYQDQLLRLHDHICPRQILGLRMGELAGEFLSLPLPQKDKRLYVFVETDGCFADGVMLATGCSLGHRTMRLEDQGKVAATFVDMRQTAQQALRIWPHPLARQRAREYVTTAQSRWHTQLDAYQQLPSDALLCSVLVELTVSMHALISKPRIRTTCDVCGEEIINERQVIRDGSCLCRTCTGISRYYQATGASSPGD